MKKLNLTPKEIFDTQFKVDLEGYCADEVDGLLDLVLDDYQRMEENVQELLDAIASLQEELKEAKAKNLELKSNQNKFDLSNTTNYSSVDILKRISRLEEKVYKK